jgi:hypothetical protein
VKYTYDQMERDLTAWKDRKAQLLQQRVDVLKPATELRAQRDKYLSDRLPDVSSDTIEGLERKMAAFETDIRQIHIQDIDLVDRCETCHLGTREPVTLTKAAVGGEAAFTSHPNRELLKIHDPENFGCTPCHGGNGVALTSVTKGHGRHKYWLWPMHYRENFEAGCQQCHVREIVTEMAGNLNDGRELFRLRGCIGCHRYEGFDRDGDEMTAVNQEIRRLEQQRAEWFREIGFTVQRGDRTRDNAEAQRLYAHANDLKVRISQLDAKLEQLNVRAQNLVRKGDDSMVDGNVAGARAFYERAARMGWSQAAIALAATYDPNEAPHRWAVQGLAADPEAARAWYAKARDLAHAEATEIDFYLKRLGSAAPKRHQSDGRS